MSFVAFASHAYGTLPTEHRYDIDMVCVFIRTELENTADEISSDQWMVRTRPSPKGTKVIVETPRQFYGPRVCIRECGAVKVSRVPSDIVNNQMDAVLFHVAAALLSYWRTEVVESDCEDEDPDFLHIVNINVDVQ